MTQQHSESARWFIVYVAAEDHFDPGPDSPDEAHEDYYQRRRDEADRDQMDLHHGQGTAEAERRLAWLMERYHGLKGWREDT